MKCLKCDHTIPDDSVFCEFCGSKVDAQNTYEESSVKKIYCRQCGKEVMSDSVFCEFCGSQIEVPNDPVYQEEMYSSSDFDKAEQSEEYAEQLLYEPTPQEHKEDENTSAKSSNTFKIITAVSCMVCVAAICISLLLMLFSKPNDKDIKTEKEVAVTISSAETSVQSSSVTTSAPPLKDEDLNTQPETTALTTAPTETTTKKEGKVTANEELSLVDLYTKFNYMNSSSLREYIGDDYYVTTRTRYDGTEVTGITSDTYFKNILVFPPDSNYYDEDTLAEMFEDTDNGFIFVAEAFEGGLIGDNSKVGDTYKYMSSHVDCIAGVRNSGYSASIVDNELVNLYFDVSGYEFSDEEYDPNPFVDLSHTDKKCIGASIGYAYGEPPYFDCTIKNSDGNAWIRNVPNADDSESARLWMVKDGDDIEIVGYDADSALLVELNGEEWYEVGYYGATNSEGETVRKIGYIETKYVNTK